MAHGQSKLPSSIRLVSDFPQPVRHGARSSSPPAGRLRRADLQEMDGLRAANANLAADNVQLMRELAVLRRREAEALRLADRDGLTGLYNRRCLMELLSAAIEVARAQRQYVGVLFIDLNGFKAVNDQHGHAAGDKVLVTVAARISARVRSGDSVCRYGGDEFAVVLPRLPDAGALERIADALRERVALPYEIGFRVRHLSAAIGASLYPHDGDSAAALLQRADQAMYERKLGNRTTALRRR